MGGLAQSRRRSGAAAFSAYVGKMKTQRRDDDDVDLPPLEEVPEISEPTIAASCVVGLVEPAKPKSEVPYAVRAQVIRLSKVSVQLSWLFDWAVAPDATNRSFEVLQRCG